MVSCFFCPRTLKGDDKVANPHFEIKITKRSKRQSAVAGAAYQSGENLFSEYDQKHKDYRKKEGVVYTEVMLPSHPPGHNPHCHIMLTMRAIDENGKWLPKSRKVYGDIGRLMHSMPKSRTHLRLKLRSWKRLLPAMSRARNPQRNL